MYYELRIYRSVPGRLDVSLNRFEQHLPRIFARHGIRNPGRWTATAGPDMPAFVYLLTYDSLDERERQWDAFYRDPDWHQVRAETQGSEEALDGFELYFLKRSPVWVPAPQSDNRARGMADLIFWRIAVGQVAAANDYLIKTLLPLVNEVGGNIMWLADFMTGPQLPRLALMIDWQSAQARERGWQTINADPGLHEAIASQRKALGRPLLSRSDNYVVDPTPFDLPYSEMLNRS